MSDVTLQPPKLRELVALKIGAQGWIAYLDKYPLHVEFLGWDSHDPDYPSTRRQYYRALESIRTDYEDVDETFIVDEDGDTKLFASREGAVEAANQSREYWAKRKRDELASLEKPIS